MTILLAAVSKGPFFDNVKIMADYNTKNITTVEHSLSVSVTQFQNVGITILFNISNNFLAHSIFFLCK